MIKLKYSIMNSNGISNYIHQEDENLILFLPYTNLFFAFTMLLT